MASTNAVAVAAKFEAWTSSEVGTPAPATPSRVGTWGGVVVVAKGGPAQSIIFHGGTVAARGVRSSSRVWDGNCEKSHSRERVVDEFESLRIVACGVNPDYSRVRAVVDGKIRTDDYSVDDGF